MNIFKKILKFNFFKATIIFMAILMIIGLLVKIVSTETTIEDRMQTPYIVYPVHLMVKALASICESVTPPSEGTRRCYNSSLSTLASILYSFYYYFLAYFVYKSLKKYLFKNKEIINIVFINKFKKIIKFSFGKVIIATALVVIPTMIINFLIQSIPPTVDIDSMSSMETAGKYITYINIPHYPIKLVKRTLKSTCKLITPPSDDIFRCQGKFMGTIYFLLSISYNYLLACLIYVGFKKYLFKNKNPHETIFKKN